jgi:hypothetical protein
MIEMIERKSVVDQIEITHDGIVQVRIGLLIVDGDKELSRKWHRTAFDPKVPNAATLQMYEVNTHLLSMGEMAVPQSEIDRIVAHAELAAK